MWKGIFLWNMDTSEVLFCDCLVCFRSCSLFLFCFFVTAPSRPPLSLSPSPSCFNSTAAAFPPL